MANELIFVTDDELNIQQLVKYNLTASGFRVETFSTGEDVLYESKHRIPDLFILDIMLPGIDGREVCRQLRMDTRTRKTPVIMLTAKSDEFDRVLGLELGADDYITKPFSVRELSARVKALFRRMESMADNTGANEILQYQDIIMNCTKYETYKGGKLLELTLKEFKLLELLILNQGKVLTREILLDKVWGQDYNGESRTVDVHVRYLRQKIEDDDNNPAFIETIRGVGYKLKNI